MTDETKNLFDAPWYVFSSPDDEITVIENESGRVLAELDDMKTANRLARLPEMYDALWEAAKAYCKDASFNCLSKKQRCMVLMDHTQCAAIPWIELLQKVRSGK